MSNLTHPVQIVIRVDKAMAFEIDAMVESERRDTGYYVSRAVMARRLLDRGIRETKRKRKAG